MIGLVVAPILTALALPRCSPGSQAGVPPYRIAELAALAPAAVVPATAAVIIAAATTPWLAVLLAIPAVMLLIWQLPPRKPITTELQQDPRANQDLLRQRSGYACSASMPGAVRPTQRRPSHPAAHNVDVLAVQELTPRMVSRLAAAGLAQLLPFSHLDPRPGSPGAGLWARWPLTPLPPVPGLTEAAPRARIDPPGGRPVTLTAVHPLAPMHGHADIWLRELALIRQTLAAVDGPQVVAGDFNASRDHRPFRDLLAAGFRDCADPASAGPGQDSPGRLPGGRRLLRHAARSCTGLTDRHGTHGPRHTTAPY